MGNTQIVNQDILENGDLNIYIYGDIINYNVNYSIITTIFPNRIPNKDGIIKLENERGNNFRRGEYHYQYRNLNFTIKDINGNEKKKQYIILSYF